jgi:hypothetical protein
MEPSRDSHATLVDLLDRVLDKGLVLYADVIVSVAGIPLIGVNLRAALAGMETMLKYGVMQDWDQRIRAWERENRKERELPLASGEQVVLKMLGSYLYSRGIYTSWRQGYFYVTDRRIALYLPTFDEVLFHASLQSIKGLAMRGGKHLSGAEREHLCLLLEGSEVARLHASDSRQLRQAIERGMAALGLTWQETETCPQCGQEAPVRELLRRGCDRCGWVSPRVKKETLRATMAG